ncbi:hypothetical protein ACF0H5_020657 [Mactra antiquata]
MIHIRQRKMSEKLSEWLDQYTAVSQNQQHYLSRIHELRRGLETKEDKHLMATIENLRYPNKEKYKRKYPIYSLTRMEGTPVNQGPAPFPSRPCLFHDDKHGIPKLKIAPHTSPRKLAPIVKRSDTKYTVTKNEHKKHQVTPRPEMSTMRTEYETFESIAKRNKLNLPQFFNPAVGNHRKNGSKRLPMSVSTVTIIEERPDEEAEQKAFTTDTLSKKHNITVKDQKPG